MDETRATAVESAAKRSGFKLIDVREVAEIDGIAYVMDHAASGAKLLFLQNDDNDKGFSITFSTPPTNDTGVFHILEHSVLCGSDKFPVKEPFVTLLKTSMQTFLNAMTFPDKTMYPVSSTNEQDLLNLMDVYLDAVFHPNIYKDPHIFEQEGWHLELEDADGVNVLDSEGAASVDDAHLAYNGVVFNEMKGALSDPDQVLFDELSAALFPDTAYRFESGGTPSAIPTLTYEEFLQTHKKHYRPDNSYIVLYGNLDIEKFLAFINEKYLMPIAEGSRDAEVGAAEVGTSEVGEPFKIPLQKPVINTGIRKEMVTTPDGSCTGLGFVVGEAADRERITATQILIDALMGSNASPLKRALLDADIADDINGVLYDSILQPYVAITAKGLHDGATDKLAKVLDSAVRQLAGKKVPDNAGVDIDKLDMSVIEGALSHAEFIMRERNFGISDGVAMSMYAMAGWLYDDSPKAATAYIRYEDVFQSLREKLNGKYFIDLMCDIFLNNDHYAGAEIVPVEQLPVNTNEVRLKSLMSDMTHAQLEEIVDDMAELRVAQMSPDDPADAAKLPRLTREDIGKAPAWPKTHLTTGGKFPVYRHDIESHGIMYANKYFDASVIKYENMPFVSLLTTLLGKLDTSEHTAAEIDTLVQSKLGSLSFNIEVISKAENDDDLFLAELQEVAELGGSRGKKEQESSKKTERLTQDLFAVSSADVTPYISIRTSALDGNAAYAATLVREIVFDSNFEDPDKVRDILLQTKIALEQSFANSGNAVATARAYSYIDKSALLREQLTNIDFYKFLKEVIREFDENPRATCGALARKLEKIIDKIFRDKNCMLSFVGSDDAFNEYSHAGMDFGGGKRPKRKLEIPEPVDKNEAFIVPAEITYCGTAADRSSLGTRRKKARKGIDPIPMSGQWMLLGRVLSFDYLWNEVRVIGGAYGTNFRASRDGGVTFSSYRDPHIDETIERFDGASNWLKHYDPTDEEFEGYVVSTAATFDKPLKPRTMMRTQDRMFLAAYSKEEHERYRMQVIESDVSNLRALAEPLETLAKNSAVCVVGNADIIAASKLEFNVVDLFAI